jgi:hypothetical protein
MTRARILQEVRQMRFEELYARHWLGISPQAYPGLSGFLLQPFQHRIPRRNLRYHQHQPSLTSMWLTLVPSDRSTSARRASGSVGCL